MDWIALISFVIAVVGIVLQVSDAFPDHREVRKTIVIMAIGVFVGVGCSALLNTKFVVTTNFDAKFGLIYGLGAVAIIFGIFAVFMESDTASVAGLIAVCVFGATGISLAIASSKSREELSSDEIIMLANNAERQGAIDKAIGYFQKLETVTSDPATGDRIATKITALRAEQAATVQASMK